MKAVWPLACVRLYKQSRARQTWRRRSGWTKLFQNLFPHASGEEKIVGIALAVVKFDIEGWRLIFISLVFFCFELFILNFKLLPENAKRKNHIPKIYITKSKMSLDSILII